MVSKETVNAQCFPLHPISAPRQAQTSGSSLPRQHLVKASGGTTQSQYEPNLQLLHRDIFVNLFCSHFSNLIKSNQHVKISNTEAVNRNRIILLKAELLHQHSRRHAEQQRGNLHLHIYILKATASTNTSGHYFLKVFFGLMFFMNNQLGPLAIREAPV